MSNILSFACFLVILEWTTASSIPMWEYLTKEEKTSYLYSMFKNQVESYCQSSEMRNCNNELMKHGLQRLKSMPEDHLDEMDPFQRGANSIIWDNMMEGHEMMKTTPKSAKTSTTTPQPNSFEDESFSNDFGSEAAGSARIETVYRLPPPNGFLLLHPERQEAQESIQSGTPLYIYPKNSLQNNQQQKASTLYFKYPATSLTPPPLPIRHKNDVKGYDGPAVVRVYPDGSPVQESDNYVPQDEDLRLYKLSKVKIPNF